MIVEDHARKIAQRNIDEYHKGSRSGFAEGLNWALRQLDIIDEEVGRKLLARYREGNYSPASCSGSSSGISGCEKHYINPLFTHC